MSLCPLCENNELQMIENNLSCVKCGYGMKINTNKLHAEIDALDNRLFASIAECKPDIKEVKK